MREFIRDFVTICAQTLVLESPIYEFGSFIVDGQEQRADLRSLFPKKKFIGADMRPGKGVDVILNLHKIDLPNNTANTIICVETLEHVEYPRKALSEIHRVLKPGGVLIISSSMSQKIHGYPEDYWRFTPMAFTSLLQDFDTIMVDWCGDIKLPHGVVGVGKKGLFTNPEVNRFNPQVRRWKKVNTRRGNTMRVTKE
jgi:SAM-dependent methyltransferase